MTTTHNHGQKSTGKNGEKKNIGTEKNLELIKQNTYEQKSKKKYDIGILNFCKKTIKDEVIQERRNSVRDR